MPNIPDAASYVAPLGTGFQLGLQYRQAQLQKQQLAEQQRKSLFEEGIQGAQENRAQQEFQQAQAAGQFLNQRFQQRQAEEALKANDTPDGGQPYTPKAPAQILQEIYPEAAARFPGSALEKVLPVLQRQVITPYQQQQIALGQGRLGVAQQRVDTTYDLGSDRNDIYRDRAAVAARQGDARLAQGQQRITNASQAQLRQLQNTTGVQIFDPETGEVDQENLKAALDKAKQSFEFNRQMTPAERQANQIIKSDSFYSGMTPDQIEEYKAKIMANGGKPFTLTPAQETGLQKGNQIVRGIEKLADAADAYKGDFGPMFAAKAATGKYTGSNEEEQKLQQIYSQVSSGKAFDVGGKTLTKVELDAILSTIGSPMNPNFRERVKGYLQTEAEKHAQDIEVLKAGGYETNPKLRGQVKSYIENLDRVTKKLGESNRAMSENFTGNTEEKPAEHDLGNGVKVTVKRVK